MTVNKVETVLRTKLDPMVDNVDRANYLHSTFEEVNLPQDLRVQIIKWFLAVYS